ncbi:MAG: NAD(P)/FAD-dependent oxidoreductase [Steroidobacteraceae bacterium]
MSSSDWDVVIVGAGPAGLSAALILGRCRRRVLLSDAGTPRSWAAHRMHGFLSRDGMELNAFRATSLGQLTKYPDVTFNPTEVTAMARGSNQRFSVRLRDGSEHVCRKILLASGVFDQLPDLPGIEQFFGTTVHPCPYCEGWEMQDLPIAIYGLGIRGFEMARAITAWSSDLLLCTDGTARLSADQRRQLSANGVEIITERIAGLLGESGQLQAIQFANGDVRPRRALFFDTPSQPQSRLAQQLGCRMTRSGSIHCGQYEASSVPGVYAAGNILKDVQLSIVAAAEGARAAFGINLSLTREDFAQRAERLRHPPRHLKWEAK